MKKNLIPALVIFSLIPLTSTANNEYQKWLQQQQSSFQQYKDERDKAFTDFLKNNWKEMQLLKGESRDPKPKPVSIPIAIPIAKPDPISRIPETPTEPVAVPVKPVKPPVTIIETPKAKLPVSKAPYYKGRKISLDFMGERVNIYYDSKLRANITNRINKKTISDHWSKLSTADYESLLEQLNNIRMQKNLNDWAFTTLVNQVSRSIYGSRTNAITFLNWFLLVKADYEARIAYDDNSLYLLLPSKQPLYSIPYFTFDNVRFYSIRFDGKTNKLGSVYTYDGKYPDATKPLDMRLVSDMSTMKQMKMRKLDFAYKGKKYSIDAFYDLARIDFLKTYPQLDLDLYYSSKVATNSAQALHQQLAAAVSGMSEQDAVNLLLRFVQTSLDYKTDDNQFGEENYLFLEETLHYRYSDCEDRSILFAWLVKNVLGLDVVGLDYPGHVAAAVAMNGPVSGNRVTYKGKIYTVADPTYINASLGMTMPEFKGIQPKVIFIN